jgi:hypothetical protein
MRAGKVFVLATALALCGCGVLKKKKSHADAGAIASAEPLASASASAAAAPEAANAKEVARFQDETLLARDTATIEQPITAHKSPPSGERVALLPKGTSVTRIAQRKAFILVTFGDPSNKTRTLMGWVNEVGFKPLPPLGKGQCRGDADCRKPERCINADFEKTPPMCRIACDASKAGSCPKGWECNGTGKLVAGNAATGFCMDVDDDDDVPAADAGARGGSTPIAAGDAGSAKVATSFKVGDKVQVEWHGSWYRATVIGVVAKDKWKIHYDGYDDSWDEVVGPSRIKPR